jgi:molybdopterin converting factor small subunit
MTLGQTKSQVEVRFLSTFFNLAKKETIIVDAPEGADLNFVIGAIENKLGHEVVAHIREHLDYVVLAVNNVDCKQLNGLETKVKDGDRIVIGHVIAGG